MSENEKQIKIDACSDHLLHMPDWRVVWAIRSCKASSGSGVMAGIGIAVLAFDQTIESAYQALATRDALITVRDTNRDITGVFTPKQVFDALART